MLPICHSYDAFRGVLIDIFVGQFFVYKLVKKINVKLNVIRSVDT